MPATSPSRSDSGSTFTPIADVNRGARRWAVLYLLAQGIGAAVWWGVILALPASRRHFIPEGCPDSVLLALLAPDSVLYVGGSFACAIGLAGSKRWAWPALCVHAGACAYVSLFSYGLTALSGCCWIGAVMMTPSLVAPATFAWLLAPGRRGT